MSPAFAAFVGQLARLGGWSGRPGVIWVTALASECGLLSVSPRAGLERPGCRHNVKNTSYFEQLGGEPGLRAVIDRFIDRVFDDLMIGFFFARASRARVKEKEYELAARHLGADIAYTGRPLDEVHRRHPIMGGQFMRRLKILEEVLVEAGAPEPVRRHWLAHDEAQRHLVTQDAGGRCDPNSAAARAKRARGGEA